MTAVWSKGLAQPTVPAGNLFLSDDWLEAYLAHQPAGRFDVYSLCLNGARLAFSYDRQKIRRIPCRVMRVMGDPLADQCWFEASANWDWPSAIGAMRDGPECDVMILSELRAEAGEREKIDRAIAASGLRGHWRQCGRAPVVPLDAEKPMTDADYAATLRRRLKRSRKKLEAAGVVSVMRTCPEPGEVDGLLETLKVIEDGSWKGDAETGLFGDERLAFVRDLSHRLAGSGALEIYVMTLDGKPISYRYGFRHGNRFLDYNLAYLKEYHHLSPGRILLDEIVKTSQDLGLEAVDASRGSLERPHILADWPGHIRDHYRLTLYAPTLKGRLLHGIETRLRPAILHLRERFKKSD